MKELIISDYAEADLVDIGKYIAQDNHDAAISFIKRLKQRCNELLPFPGVGRKRDEIQPGFRSVTEGNYVIFYRVKGEAVEIMRIFEGTRIWARCLRKGETCDT